MKWTTVHRRTYDVCHGDVQVGERHFRLDLGVAPDHSGKVRVLVLAHRGRHLDDWVWRDAWDDGHDFEAAEMMDEALFSAYRMMAQFCDDNSRGDLSDLHVGPEGDEDSHPVEGDEEAAS